MRKGNVLAIAVMAFALVAFLFVLDYSINPSGKWPWSMNEIATTENANPMNISNSTTNTNTPTNVTNASDVSNNTNSTNTNTISYTTYSSDVLGIRLQYPSTWKVDPKSKPADITFGATVQNEFYPYVTLSVRTIPGGLSAWPQNFANEISYDIKTSKSITISGEKGYALTLKDTEVIAFAVEKDEQLYEFSFNTTTEKDIDHFISSVKLLGFTKGWRTYISEANNILFQYDSSATAQESGKKIFVTAQGSNSSQGQYVERFNKMSDTSLDTAMQEQLLKNYAPTDCFIEAITYTKPNSWTFKTIGYPVTDSSIYPAWANGEKCPQPYSKSNGLSYFTAPPNSTYFYYFSIGQYAIKGTSANVPWQDTIQVVW